MLLSTMGLKWTEILLIMGVLLLLFGATRLPQLGSSLGSAIRNFKKGFSGEGEEGDGKPAGADAKLSQGEGQGTAPDKAAQKHS